MMWSIFITALGLLFVLEGMLPFLSPPFWRGLMQKMFLQDDRALRVMGLIFMLVGLALVVVARDLYNN